MPQTRILTMKADDLSGYSQGLRDAQGAPIEGAIITFTLVDNQGRAVEMVDRPTGQDVLGRQEAITDANGEMSIGLWANTRSNDPSWYFVRIDHPGYRDFLAWIEESGDVLPWNDFRGTTGVPDGLYREGHIIRRGTAPDPAPQDMPQRSTLQFNGLQVIDDDVNGRTIVTNTAGDGGIGGDLGDDLNSAGHKFFTSDQSMPGGTISGVLWDDNGIATLEGSKGDPGAVGDELPLQIDGSTVTVEGRTATAIPAKNQSGPGFRVLHQGKAGTIASEPPAGLFYGSAANTDDLQIHAGTGIGPWVLITGAAVMIDQAVGIDTLRIYAEGMIAESGNESGQIEWGVSISDQAEPLAALAPATTVIAGNTVPGGVAAISDAAFAENDTIYLWARGRGGTDDSFSVALLGSQLDTGIGLYIPGASGGGGGTESPLTTKGDLYGFSTVEARFPVGADNWLMTPADAETVGLKYAKLKDIPLDPDDLGAGFPGAGGEGIMVPTDVPVPVGGVVTYKTTDGTEAEGNPSAMILGGHKLESTDTVILDISSLLGAGTTLHILPGGGGSSLRIEVPAEPGPDNPMKITSEGAALEIDGDGGVLIQEMLWDMRAPETAGGYVTAVSEDTLQLSAATGPSTPSVVGSGFIP